MQLWMEINVVMDQVVETMPPQTRSVTKAKGGLLQKARRLLFLDGQYICTKKKMGGKKNYYIKIYKKDYIKSY